MHYHTILWKTKFQDNVLEWSISGTVINWMMCFLIYIFENIWRYIFEWSRCSYFFFKHMSSLIAVQPFTDNIFGKHYQLIVAQWRHMSTKICFNIGLCNGLLPGGTKPLPRPMLTYLIINMLAFTLEQFHKRYFSHQLLELVWKLFI